MVGPHGNFYGYLIAFLVIVLLMSIGIPMLADFLNDMAAQSGSSEAASETDPSLLFGSPLTFLASNLLLFGLVSIFASWCVTAFCWTEMRSGFDRTIVSGCGKKTYYLEKLLFALIVSFAFVVIGMVVAAAAAALTKGFVGGSSLFSLVAWCVLLSLLCWACASLTLAVLWLFRSHVLAIIVGLTLASGAVSSIVSMVFGSVQAVADVWGKIVEWFPTSAFSALSAVFDGELALEGIQWAHFFVPVAVCLAAAYACVLCVLRRRDL